MNRLKFFVPKHVLLTLYNSLVLPYLNYSVVTWCRSSSCDRLFILQKRAIRLISGSSFREHTLPLFANLKLLQFNDLYYLNVGKFMYKFMNGFLPSCFNHYFTLTSDIHCHDTRSIKNKNLHVGFSRTTLFKISLIQRGIRYWNSLSLSLKTSLTLPIFMSPLKIQLLASYV